MDAGLAIRLARQSRIRIGTARMRLCCRVSVPVSRARHSGRSGALLNELRQLRSDPFRQSGLGPPRCPSRHRRAYGTCSTARHPAGSGQSNSDCGRNEWRASEWQSSEWQSGQAESDETMMDDDAIERHSDRYQVALRTANARVCRPSRRWRRRCGRRRRTARSPCRRRSPVPAIMRRAAERRDFGLGQSLVLQIGYKIRTYAPFFPDRRRVAYPAATLYKVEYFPFAAGHLKTRAPSIQHNVVKFQDWKGLRHSNASIIDKIFIKKKPAVERGGRLPGSLRGRSDQ